MATGVVGQGIDRDVSIPIGKTALEGNLAIPENARGIVLFAHGSGSSRHSPRNRYVAEMLRKGGLGTLLMDLLTPAEEQADEITAHLRFNIDLLAERLVLATHWLKQQHETQSYRVGYFDASTGGGAALVAAARQPGDVHAVVSRGGRPDLAGRALAYVKAPTLLIVGSKDFPVITMNNEGYQKITAPKRMELVPGATHLFQESGALQRVAQLARDWFQQYLGGS